LIPTPQNSASDNDSHGHTGLYFIHLKPTSSTLNSKLLVWLALVLGGMLTIRNCDAAIVYPQPPEGGEQIVSQFATPLLKHDRNFLGSFQMKDLTIARPYRDYGITPRDLVSGRLCPAAQSGGAWIYLLMHGTNAVGMEELVADAKTGALKFNGLYQSNGSSETMEVLRIAEQWPQVKKQDYEVRRLDCAPLLFRAVWLHGKSDDIIIPLPDTFNRWLAFHPYSEKEMLKLLKPEAKKKLAEPPGMID
jgi:hypothetical protein